MIFDNGVELPREYLLPETFRILPPNKERLDPLISDVVRLCRTAKRRLSTACTKTSTSLCHPARPTVLLHNLYSNHQRPQPAAGVRELHSNMRHRSARYAPTASHRLPFRAESPKGDHPIPRLPE